MQSQNLDHGYEEGENDERTDIDVNNLQEEGEVDYQAVYISPLDTQSGKEIGLEQGVAGEGGTEEEEGGDSYNNAHNVPNR